MFYRDANQEALALALALSSLHVVFGKQHEKIISLVTNIYNKCI